jgi:predicted adenylyl cyclase CyaB
LREEKDASPQLIGYARPAIAGQRESRYRIVEVANGEALMETLADTLGIRAVVAKSRHLFTLDATRIHLDEVEDLGNFIEIEAVAPPESDLSEEVEQVNRLRSALEIREGDLVAGSYCDLMLDRT